MNDAKSPTTPKAGHSERCRGIAAAGNGLTIKPSKQGLVDKEAALTLPPGAVGTLQRTLQVLTSPMFPASYSGQRVDYLPHPRYDSE